MKVGALRESVETRAVRVPRHEIVVIPLTVRAHNESGHRVTAQLVNVVSVLTEAQEEDGACSLDQQAPGESVDVANANNNDRHHNNNNNNKVVNMSWWEETSQSE